MVVRGTKWETWPKTKKKLRREPSLVGSASREGADTQGEKGFTQDGNETGKAGGREDGIVDGKVPA